MTFKLRSGNTPIFKKIGSKKESAEEYNTKLKKQYEDQMQSYTDSTTAYENKKEYLQAHDEARKAKEEMDKIAMKHGSEAADYIAGTPGEKDHYKWTEHPDKELIGTIPKRKLTNEELATHDEWQVMSKKQGKLLNKGLDIHEKNLDLGIYTQLGGDRKNPNDLRPKFTPKKPAYKISTIDKLKVLPIDTGEDKVKLQTSKLKYMTSKDGKTKTNLETGEVTKVKTQKVKRKRKPNKRKVKNLITGKNNKIM